MPFNVSRGTRSQTQDSPLTPDKSKPCPCSVVEALSRHVAGAFTDIPGSMEERQTPHVEVVARSAPHKRLRLASGGFKSSSEFAGSGSEDYRPGKLEYDVRNRAGDGPPARLKLHAKHLVLRKISKALRVRINPSMDELGPYIVIDNVTSAEILIIAQIFED
ncbi:hypothetical protein WNY61_19815 [Sulfitobacter sp. AS92]|uniref:hypothetical protein n=1 Tax=Sulfitobacter sp. AS92 TaxID=3135783 RepID=UPI0031824BB2